MRRRPLIVFLSLFPLLALTGFAGSQALASTTQSQAGRIAVEGQLTGSPSLAGIRLALYAMPPQPVMAKLRVGDRVQGQLVGVATSSPTGAYAIRVSDPAAVTSSAFRGVVNFEVWAAGHAGRDGYVSLFGFSRRIAAGNALVPLFGQATTAPVRATLRLHRISQRAAAEPDVALSSGCWLLNTDLGPKWAAVEGLWSTITGVQKHLTYNSASTSSVSIGVSVNDGPWTTGNSGNTSVSGTAGNQGFPSLPGRESKVGQTLMEEGIFNTCQISSEIGTFPYAVDGGDGWLNSSPPKATYCVPELANGYINMNRTQSFTFAGGIDLLLTFGISLSTLTGYSSSSSIKYDYSDNGYACGTHDYPLRSDDIAHGVVADATVNGNS